MYLSGGKSVKKYAALISAIYLPIMDRVELRPC